MSKKFYTICGTRENFFEAEVNEFNTREEAEKHVEEYEEGEEESGYDTWTAVAEGEEERDEAIAEIEEYRESEIEENFGDEDEEDY